MEVTIKTVIVKKVEMYLQIFKLPKKLTTISA